MLSVSVLEKKVSEINGAVYAISPRGHWKFDNQETLGVAHELD